jgi:hypothetical protein
MMGSADSSSWGTATWISTIFEFMAYIFLYGNVFQDAHNTVEAYGPM